MISESTVTLKHNVTMFDPPFISHSPNLPLPEYIENISNTSTDVFAEVKSVLASLQDYFK
jgi:hypothetical protein